MNRFTNLLPLLLSISAATAQANEPTRIQDLPLNDHTVYTVPVSATRVTTISFPSPIAAIDGALLTPDGKTPGLFQIAHTKGTAYFSLRALAKDAATNVNVRWNNRTYAFELHESTEPVYSVVLKTGPEPTTHAWRSPTPAQLLGLIDKAKAFPLLQKQQPDAIAGVEYHDAHEHPLVSDCGDYEIRVTEAFRFPEQDALVFHLLIGNRSDKPLDHTPEQLEVHVGDRVFTPSLTDLASGIPPHESTLGYVVVSGGPNGRNELSLKNDFTFVLSRREPSPQPAEQDDPKDVEPTPIPQ